MKPDQERVKNLLLDTVTLLCKNSLQYENKLRVEGLLGVSVDESDVFFLHISENFQNSTAVDTNNVSGKESEVVTDSNRESSHDREDVSSQIQDSRDSVSEQIRVKSEIHDVGSDSDDLIITSSSLNSPHTVAQPATVVAGQRRSPHKRTHSPSFRDSIHNSSQISQNSQRDSLNSTNQMTSLDGDYTYSECGDGTSFDQLQSQHMIKQETGWDQEPAAKRHMSDSSPWPNLAGLSDLAAQAAQASQDGDDGGGGSYSQPGCSSWPSASTPLLPNSGVQDTECSKCLQLKDQILELKEELAKLEARLEGDGKLKGYSVPRGGFVSKRIAEKYKMVELVAGRGVYVHPSDLEAVNKAGLKNSPNGKIKCGQAMVRRLIRAVWAKEELMGSTLKAGQPGSLDETMVSSVIDYCVQNSSTKPGKVRNAIWSAITSMKSKNKKDSAPMIIEPAEAQGEQLMHGGELMYMKYEPDTELDMPVRVKREYAMAEDNVEDWHQ